MISNVNSWAIVTSSICEPIGIVTSHWSIILTLFLWTLSSSQRRCQPGRFSMAAHCHDRRRIYRCVLLRFCGRKKLTTHTLCARVVCSTTPAQHSWVVWFQSHISMYCCAYELLDYNPIPDTPIYYCAFLPCLVSSPSPCVPCIDAGMSTGHYAVAYALLYYAILTVESIRNCSLLIGTLGEIGLLHIDCYTAPDWWLWVSVGKIAKMLWFLSLGMHHAGTILCMRPANERQCYIVTSSLIGWGHTQNDLWQCRPFLGHLGPHCCWHWSQVSWG